MNRVAKSFFQGLLVLVPLVVTAFVVWKVVATIDGWLRLPVPGAGVALTFLVITLVGFLASNVMGRRVVDALEKALARLPVVKLLYSSLRDLLNAFVGERRSFDRPVMVDMPGGIKLLGFVTCDTFDDVKLRGHVAVYLPQSYNFAGNLLVVPEERVRPVDADGAQFMAFVVSGGVAEMNAAQTVYDAPLFPRDSRKGARS